LDIPVGWTRATLGDVVDVVRGVSYDKSEARYEPGPGFVPILRATNIGERLDFDDLVYVPEARVSEDQHLRRGDIVVAASSGSRSVVGKAAPLLEPWEGGFGAFCLAVRPKLGVHPRFVSYFMATSEYRERVSGLAAGVNINNLKRQHITETPIPLAPLAHQDRIVAEIDKQFTRLEAGVDALNRLQAHLRSYQAAVLKAACEVADPEPAGPGRAWTFESLMTLAESTQIGLDRGKAQQSSDPSAGLPYIKMNNVTMDGEVLSEKLAYVPASSEERRKFAVRAGDLLLNTRNSVELVGKVGIVPSSLDGALYNNNLMRIRLREGVDPDFMCQQMCAPGFRARLERVKKATTSVAAVYAKDLLPLQLAVPPLNEQARRSGSVKSVLSVLDNIKAVAETAEHRAARLRRSILARAFAGEITDRSAN
jgi:type I restriction enzyme S subunit